MRKIIIRLTALALAGVLGLAFTGCGNTPEETTTEPIAETTAATTTAEETTTEATTTETTTIETTTETTTEATTTTEETTTEETTTVPPVPVITADDIENHTKLELWKGVEIPYQNSRRPMTPTIQPYIVEGSKSCVVIFPGGGYFQLSSGSEGTDIAKAYNEKGISAFVVYYRYAPQTKEAILADAQRSIQFVRYYAEDFGIDEDKIAVCGFSAGGHLAMLVCQHAPEENLGGDAIGEVSSAPNACILSYAVTTLEPGTSSGLTPTNFLGYENVNDEELIAKYSYTYNPKAMPATFLWYCSGDSSVNPKANSEALAAVLKDLGTTVECIGYFDGGHGIGLGTSYKNASGWHDASVAFLKKVFAE